MLWRIGTGGLRVLATCHTLQSSDYPISSIWDAAYVESSRLIFEADIRAPEIRSVGISTGDDTLFRRDPELYRRVEAALTNLGQDVSKLRSSKPWHAGLRLAMGLIQREGFDYRYSLDNWLRVRAETDRKTVAFLEAPSDQFHCFEAQPLADQIYWLNYSLAHEAWGVQQIHRILNGWRRADLPGLESVLSDYLNLLPQLYRCLIIGRNDNWLPRLEAFAKDSVPTLVCVGTLHCVGERGLPSLLVNRGWSLHLEDERA
jgi:uncharacterized protein YbaP (TraB family)